MADASLDDFFAKKDKSKKKPKKQVVDVENLVDGEPQKKSGKKKKDKSKKKKENENKDDQPAEETNKVSWYGVRWSFMVLRQLVVLGSGNMV